MTDLSGKNYQDRHGIKLEVGQVVRVQHCVGRYGQTEIVEGRIADISAYGGITLDQAVSRGRSLGKVYVTVTRKGYEKFDDFEHGHEKWTEVLTSPNS
jgi:hypothetical protein